MDRKTRYTDYAIILGVLLLGMWQLCAGIALMKWDIMDITLPWNFFITESLNNGHLPLWNPYMNSGFPQTGDPATWYPVTWLIGFLSRFDIHAIQFEYLLHLYIAGMGMYKVAEQKGFSRSTRLILAVGYMLSGFFISNAQHLGWIVGAAWFPWVFYYFEKILAKPCLPDALKLAFVMFLLLSGGYPGIFISVAYILAFYFLYAFVISLREKQYNPLRKQAFCFSVAAVTFLVFSAAVLISSFDLSRYVIRGGGLKYDHGSWGILTGSLPPKAWITFFFPFATAGNEAAFWGDDFSLLNCYIGLLPLVVLVTAFFGSVSRRKTVWLAVTGIVFLMISMAGVFPIRRWLLILPFMNLLRLSALFRIFALFFFLLAAGYAWEQIKEDTHKFFKVLCVFAGIFIISEVVAGFNLDVWKYKTIFTDGWNAFLNTSGIGERVFLQGAVALGLLAAMMGTLKHKPVSKPVLPWILFILFCMDMLVALQLNFYATVGTGGFAKRINSCFRSFPVSDPVPDLSVPLRRNGDAELKPTMDFLGRNLAIYYKVPSWDGNSPYGLYTMDSAIKKGTYDALLDHPFLFLASGLTQKHTVEAGAVDTLSSQHITINTFHNNGFDLTVKTPGAQYLVCLQNGYPGWEVKVNGQKQEILRVNDTFMAVRLDAGTQRVEFRFRPIWIMVAAWISMISWACFLVYILITQLKRRNQNRYRWKRAAVLVMLAGILGGVLLKNANRQTSRKIYATFRDKIARTLAANDSIQILLNVDHVAALGKIRENPLVDSYDDSGIAGLMTLLGKNHPKLLYCEANRICHPEIRYIIRDYYPGMIAEEDDGHAYWMSVSRSADGKDHVESCNDFEQEWPHWSQEAKALDTTRTFSGRCSYSMDTTREYSATFRCGVSEFRNKPQKAIVASAWFSFSGESSEAVILVLSIRRGQKDLLYLAKDVHEFMQPGKVWQKAYLVADLEHMTLRRGDEIAVYCWNKNRRTFRMDDFSIKSY